MPFSARRFKGKLKREIASEAFQELGANATVQQVDKYFRTKYGLPFCERSMYGAAKRIAEGKPPPVRRSYRRYREEDLKDIVGVIVRVKQLAYDVGGFDVLEELVRAVK
jgi:hypothetical protein